MQEIQVIDISRKLSESIPVWPGDATFKKQFRWKLNSGELVNLSTLTLSSHTGSHADAPYHIVDKAPSIDQVDLSVYWGPAQVVTVQKTDGPLAPQDLEAYDLTRAPRLLVRTPLARQPLDIFSEQFPYPGPEFITALKESGVILYGTDALSVDAFDSATLPGHHALIENKIAILEGLDLRLAEDGLYTLSALPLRIVGGDGSPVRAALQRLSP